jgi:hypothetical protein
MSSSSRRLVRLACVTALVAAPTAVLAYGVWIHSIIPTEALTVFRTEAAIPAVKTTTIAGATDADLTQFRQWFYERASHISDQTLRGAFLKRYPSTESFDAKAFKIFMMMNPEAKVLGVDPFAEVYAARTPADVAEDPTPPYTAGSRLTIAVALEMGSVYPDIDRRNQDRLYRDSTGQVVLTADGDTVPMDPMTLNWGRLTGLSSQAAEHTGLNHETHSSNTSVLSVTPWNYVRATGYPTDSVESYGVQNAQNYTDLSYLARLSGLRGSEMLSYLYGGNAMHYVADMGNQIQTLQAGIEKFNSDATFALWLGRLKTVFGLFGSTPSRNSIALDILGNHRTLAVKLFQVELHRAYRFDSLGQADSIAPSMRGALQGLRNGDPMFKRVLDGVILGNAAKIWYPAYGSLIAGALIDSSYEEGADVYRLIRQIAIPQLHKAGVAIDFDTIPASKVWDYVRPLTDPKTKAALDTFNIIEGRGLARVHDAVSWWWDRYWTTAQTSPNLRSRLAQGILERLVRNQLIYLNASDARREDYVESHGGLK